MEEKTLREEISNLLAIGARHVAYYPDGVIEDKPRREDIATIISRTRIYPGLGQQHAAAK